MDAAKKNLVGLVSRAGSVGLSGAKKVSGIAVRELQRAQNLARDKGQQPAKREPESEAEVVAVRLINKQSGEEIQIDTFIGSVMKDGLWVVAWDAGTLALTVGTMSISVAVVCRDEIVKVLSHRWRPSARTAYGPVPQAMMLAAYPEPTWVDFLNHFNIPACTPRVVEGMGRLYAEKACRALYFEGSAGAEEVAEACSRCWMWQELSIGPQAHAYSSNAAVVLHFTVRVGEAVALDMVQRLAGFAGEAPSAVLDNLASGRGAADGIDDAVLHELTHGTLETTLATVLRSKGFEQHAAAAAAAAVAGATGAAGQGKADKGSLRGAARVLRWLAVEVVRCAELVARARRLEDEALEVGLKAYRGVAAGLRMFGCTEPPTEGGEALCAMLEAAVALETRETSAVANLGNKNVTVDGDRLVASFGVLCAGRGVGCEPGAVDEIIWGARSVTVQCRAVGEAQGVRAAMRRRVQVRKEGRAKADMKHKFNAAVSSACMVLAGAGTSLSDASFEGVWLSGLGLGKCNVQLLGGEIRKRLEARMAGVESDAGEITSFQILEGEVNGLLVRLDDSSMLEVRMEQRMAVPPFRQWFEGLPVGPGEAGQDKGE